MHLLNTQSEYGLLSRTLHWIIVAAIAVQWLLAEAQEDSAQVAGLDALTLHQSIGITVLLLAVVRLGWRLLNPKPAWPVDMKRVEINLARVVHIAFYALLFAIPLTGWALSSAEHEPIRYFDTFAAPWIVSSGEETFEEVHETLFNVLAALAALHIAGAIKHWLAARNETSSH